MKKLLLLHPTTKKLIDSFLKKPSHALLITGPAGSGKTATTKDLAASLLGTTESKLKSNPYYLTIKAEILSISIDKIRQLQDFLKLKTLGSNRIRRLVIIYEAQNLTDEAQNAFLKILEEPPTDTVLILCSSNHAQLLPTLFSRLTVISLQAPSQKNLIDHFTALGYDEAEVAKYQLLSDGRVGLLSDLLQQKADHQLLLYITNAKKILLCDKFDRLREVDTLSKDKDEAKLLLKAMEKVLELGLGNAVKKNDKPTIKKLVNTLKQVQYTFNSLEKNASSKLALTNLMLQL